MTEILVSFRDAVVQDATLLDEDTVPVRGFLREEREVADLALEAHVGDEAMHVLRVDTRGVGCIGIAVWVAVFAVEEINEVVAIVHGCGMLLIESRWIHLAASAACCSLRSAVRRRYSAF